MRVALSVIMNRERATPRLIKLGPCHFWLVSLRQQLILLNIEASLHGKYLPSSTAPYRLAQKTIRENRELRMLSLVCCTSNSATLKS